MTHFYSKKMVKSADASFSYLLHFADVLKSNTKMKNLDFMRGNEF